MFNRRKPPKTTPPPPPAPRTDPNRFTLRYSDNPEDVGRWLAQHGYRAIVAGALSATHAGVLYARPGAPAQIAIIGDTLVHDGHIVTVEPQTTPT